MYSLLLGQGVGWDWEVGGSGNEVGFGVGELEVGVSGSEVGSEGEVGWELGVGLVGGVGFHW